MLQTMEWRPSEWTALVAVIVAGISLAYTWWDRRGARAESYRTALYDRQLAVVEEFIAMVRHAHLDLALAADSDRQQRLDAARMQLAEFAISSPFIPPEVVAGARDWSDTLEEAIGATPTADSARMGLAWRRFVRRVRRETGSYDLHQQVRKITGADDASRRHRERLGRLRRLDFEVDVMSGGSRTHTSLRSSVFESHRERAPRFASGDRIACRTWLTFLLLVRTAFVPACDSSSAPDARS
jgi:hypothetical protein